MTQFLEKYTSHFIWKGCVWEGVGDWTELQHIDPHSIGHNHVSFPFSWAAQWGPGGPASLGHVPQSSIFSPSGLISKLINRGPEGSLYWVLAFSTASSPTGLVSKLIDFLSSLSYIISMPTFFLWASQIAFIQPIHGQGYTLLFLDRMHLLFT